MFYYPGIYPPHCIKGYITKTNALYAEWIKSEVEVLGSGKWAQRAFFENTRESFAKEGAKEVTVEDFAEKIALSLKFSRSDYERVMGRLRSIDTDTAEAVKKVCGV